MVTIRKAILILVALGAAILLWFNLPERLIFFEPDLSEIQMAAADPIRLKIQSLALSKATPVPIAVVDSGVNSELLEREGLTPNRIGGGRGDEVGHGTGIVLQIAARENGFGVVGYLPGAKVVTFRLGTAEEFEKGRIPFERIEEAFEAVAQSGAKVLSLSASNIIERWPLERFESLLAKFETRLLVVAAAGNDGETLNYGPRCTYSPVCARARNLIKVGATDYEYSNRGQVVDVWVESKVYSWRLNSSTRRNKAFEVREIRSTSVAVPKVAAMASLIWGERPGAQPSEIRNALLSLLKK